MDISIRLKANQEILEFFERQGRGSAPLPTITETYYISNKDNDVAERILFGVIRLRNLDGNVELSCNRRIYRNTGYEHRKYVLFSGSKEEALYLIKVLDLKELGVIEHVSKVYDIEGLGNDVQVMYSNSSSRNKSINTIKIETTSEEKLLQALCLLKIDLSLIDTIDPILYLLNS